MQLDYPPNSAASHAARQHLPLTDLSFIAVGAQWPPPSQRARLKRYADNRLLWKGQHDQVYGNWWRVLREDKGSSLELVFNWHKRLSTLWADLLLGEPPRFLDGTASSAAGRLRNASRPPRAPSYVSEDSQVLETMRPLAGGEARQNAIDRISSKDENGYVTTLYEVALDISRYGDGVAKVTLEEDGAKIWAQTPAHWFPVIDPANMRKITHHVLAWTFEQADTTYLWAEIHEKGWITTAIYRLEGNLIGQALPLASFAPDRLEVEETLVEDFLIVPFPGLRASDEIFGVDDYCDIDSVIQALEVRAGQINRILDKHSDPSMYGDPANLTRDPITGEWTFRAGGQWFDVDEDGTPPGYITWEGHLEAQFRELDMLLKQLYVISETSPAAFGQLESGLAESGSALKRLMLAPLAKVARITMRFDPAARRALKIAADLEHTHGVNATPLIPAIKIHWQDGLPPDPREQAETEAIRTQGDNPTSSILSSIQRLDGGAEEDAEAEQLRIEDEQNRRHNNKPQDSQRIPAQQVQDPREPRQTASRQSRGTTHKESN